MGKTFLSSIILIMVMLFTACSNDPFVGDWGPNNDPSGSIFSFDSDGTAEFYGNGDAGDGFYSMKGTWSHVEGNDNSIKVKFDPATIKIKFKNPIEAEILRAVLREMASTHLPFTISEDGERLDGGGNGYFERL